MKGGKKGGREGGREGGFAYVPIKALTLVGVGGASSKRTCIFSFSPLSLMRMKAVRRRGEGGSEAHYIIYI
jgi:hypothetical protein